MARFCFLATTVQILMENKAAMYVDRIDEESHISFRLQENLSIGGK